MLSKIGKASKYAYELFQLCKERADERSQLEAEAYAAFMFGNVLLEKERWKQAQAAFTKAQNRYSEMARLAPMSDEKDGGAQCERKLTISEDPVVTGSGLHQIANSGGLSRG